jgi:hypothetical protein
MAMNWLGGGGFSDLNRPVKAIDRYPRDKAIVIARKI